MPITLIESLSPSILVLSVLVPLLTGFFGGRLGVSIGLGWFLFVLSFLFQDIFSLMLANHFHGIDGVRAVAVDQPGTVAAVFAGAAPALLGHFLGRGLRRLQKRVFGSEQNLDGNHL